MVCVVAGRGLEPRTPRRIGYRAVALPTKLSGLVAGERETGASRKSSPRLPPACLLRTAIYEPHVDGDSSPQAPSRVGLYLFFRHCHPVRGVCTSRYVVVAVDPAMHVCVAH